MRLKTPKRIADDLMWFAQARCDDFLEHHEILPKLRRSGLSWILLGVESKIQQTLDAYNKGIRPEDTMSAEEERYLRPRHVHHWREKGLRRSIFGLSEF
ncbi:MAG: hypothetical protein ACUVTL_06435 [Thermoproteota archaeon]